MKTVDALVLEHVLFDYVKYYEVLTPTPPFWGLSLPITRPDISELSISMPEVPKSNRNHDSWGLAAVTLLAASVDSLNQVMPSESLAG